MRLYLYHNAMSMLLTALLLASSVGAHGFGHAHVGGDKSHFHADDATVAHDGDSPACPHDHDPMEKHNPMEKQPHQGENYLATASISHTHLTLLGFDFSIPNSDNSRDDQDESQSLIFVRLGDECTIVPVVRSHDTNLLRTLLLTARVGDVMAVQVATFAMPQVSSAPLCDSARFERSGVLLS